MTGLIIFFLLLAAWFISCLVQGTLLQGGSCVARTIKTETQVPFRYFAVLMLKPQLLLLAAACLVFRVGRGGGEGRQGGAQKSLARLEV